MKQLGNKVRINNEYVVNLVLALFNNFNALASLNVSFVAQYLSAKHNIILSLYFGILFHKGNI